MTSNTPRSRRSYIKKKAEEKSQEFHHQKAKVSLKKAKSYRLQSQHKLLDAQVKYIKAKQSESKVKIEKAKENLETAKLENRVAKQVKNKAVQRNGGSLSKKTARKGYGLVRQSGEAAWQDNETLEDIAQARQKIRQTHVTAQQSKRMAKYSLNIIKKSGGSLYGVTNRSYNFVRGNGFTRTLKQDRFETKLLNRLKPIKKRLMRLKSNRFVKGVHFVSRPLKSIVVNPLSLKSYLFGFLLFCLLALFSGDGGVVQQDEFDLNESWTYLTKLDRENSNDKVDYWTDLDPVMAYMNYRYHDYHLTERWLGQDAEKPDDLSSRTDILGIEKTASKPLTYEDLLKRIWESLNKPPEELKTMEQLYTSKASENRYLRLSGDDLEEYKELLEQAEEKGLYPNYNDLANLFYTEDDEAHYDNPLVITKRFGYESKGKLYEGSIIQADSGQDLLAVFSGKVEIKDKDVLIKTKEAVFTYKDVNTIAVKNGQKVSEGDKVGKVKSSNGQEVYYKKLKERDKKKRDVWKFVNVGFYFPKVKYNQTTSVISDLNFSGNLAANAKIIADHIKKKVKGATDNGIAAMFGNFLTESNLNPKRAEGDYLAPPVGASANSWDDPAWLAIGGPAIYGGAYPNILRRGLGLGQWTDTADGSTRHTLLLNYAQSKNKKWYDLELQIDFILEGDAPYYQEIAKKILTSSDDVTTLTQRFLNQWEGNAGDKLAERQNNARQVLAYLKNPTISGETKGGSSTIQSSWGSGMAAAAGLKTFPSSATVSASLDGNTYPVGQCTWYVYNRLVEAGVPHYNWLGNGQDWVAGLVVRGWTFSNQPVVGAVCSTAGGFDGTYWVYGHVSYVEAVFPDGSFLVSQCNIDGVQNQIHWMVKQNAPYFTFAVPPKK